MPVSSRLRLSLVFSRYSTASGERVPILVNRELWRTLPFACVNTLLVLVRLVDTDKPVMCTDLKQLHTGKHLAQQTSEIFGADFCGKINITVIGEL